MVNIYAQTGRICDALLGYTELLALQEEKLGVEHHDTQLTASNLARLYSVSGQKKRARKVRKKFAIKPRQGKKRCSVM